jgi:tetratricopeptide (TPR) repeat protein
MRFRQVLAHQALPGDRRAKLLADLSTALRQRAAYRRRASGTVAAGEPEGSPDADLDEAIDLMRRAVSLSLGGEEELYGAQARELAERYAGLGAALLNRGQVGGTRADLREAADSFEKAVRLAPADDTQIGAYLTGLGIASRELALFADAVRWLREAIGETPSGDPERPRRQAELAIALIGRYEHEEHRGDLIEAWPLLTEAIATLTSSRGARHPDTLSARVVLARAYVAAGWSDEARAILTDVLPGLTPEHPDYRAARKLDEALRA